MAVSVPVIAFFSLLVVVWGCIPTVTPDDMYEEEMTSTTSVLMTLAMSSTTSTSPSTTTTPMYICTPGWVLYTSYCYYFDDTTRRLFADAEANCQAITMGVGHLASIHSDAENQFIYDEIAARRPMFDYWYIGLMTPPTFWTDGTPFDHNGFRSGEPNGPAGQCVGMYIRNADPTWNGEWNDDPCGAAIYRAVCKVAATPFAG